MLCARCTHDLSCTHTVFDVITELFAYEIMAQKNAAITEPPWTLNDVPR